MFNTVNCKLKNGYDGGKFYPNFKKIAQQNKQVNNKKAYLFIHRKNIEKTSPLIIEYVFYGLINFLIPDDSSNSITVARGMSYADGLIPRLTAEEQSNNSPKPSNNFQIFFLDIFFT